MIGTIKTVKDKGFGFIRVHGEPGDVFFHVSSLAEGLIFSEQLVGMEVEFEIVGGPKGAAAKQVRPAKVEV